MLSLVRRYMPPVTSYRIDRYEHEGALFRVKMRLEFIDGSVLYVKEYRFLDGSRKYSFHWVDAVDILKIRWDNAEHWPEIATFPHHKHIGADALPHLSTETSLDAVLQVIAAKYK